MLAAFDSALLIEGDIFAALQGGVLAAARRRINRTAGDAYIFRVVFAHAETCARLCAEVALRQRRNDRILRAFGLLFRADVDLPARDRHADLRAVAAFDARVVAD